MKGSLLQVIYLGFAGLVACQNKVVSKDDLIAYTMDKGNGIYKSYESGATTIDVIYHSKDFIIAQELADSKFTQIQIDSIVKHYSPYDYFILKVSRDGMEAVESYSSDPIRFNGALDYLSFKVGSDLTLVHKRDTIPVTDFLYARTYGAGKGSSVLLAFNSALSNKNGEVMLVFADEFFGTGTSEYVFDLDDIKSIPNLPLKN